MQPPKVLKTLSSIKVWVSSLSTYKVLMALSNIGVSVSQISKPRPRGYIDPDITSITISCFISTIILLNTIRLLPVY